MEDSMRRRSLEGSMPPRISSRQTVVLRVFVAIRCGCGERQTVSFEANAPMCYTHS